MVLTAFFRKKLIVALLMLTFLLIIAPILPQEDAPTPPVISAENIHQLQSIAKIDLADYKDDFGEFITGWFAVDENGTQFVTSSEQRDLIVFTESGEVTYEFNLAPGHLNADDAATAMLVDAVFGDEDTLITLFDGTTAQRNVDEDGETQFASIPIAYIVDHGDNMDSVEIVHMINTVGKSVWLDDDSQIGIEATQYDTETPSEVVYFFPTEQRNRTLSLPYAPAEDEEAVVRIGRIQPPTVVTSSIDGLVKRWDLNTGEVTAEVQVANGPVVFGQINTTGRYLAWRDPASTNLNLLDFKTGENQIVAPLRGEYVQYFFVGTNADVILGVSIEDRPIVVAWIVETGDMIELGAYRACNRQPDMARLSKDGTTLVIGCDTGLDIWRIEQRN